MSDILTQAPDKHCISCGNLMARLWRCDPPPAVFRGWFCSNCNEHEPAIGREKLFTGNLKDDKK